MSSAISSDLKSGALVYHSEPRPGKLETLLLRMETLDMQSIYRSIRIVAIACLATLPIVLAGCGSYGSGGNSGTSTVPAAPTGLMATAGNAQVALTWTPSTGATLYYVKRAGTTGATTAQATQALTPADLMAAQALVRRLPIGESVVDAILKLVRAGRPDSSDLDVVRQRIAWGPGPRASQALMLAVRAKALIDGRLAPSVDDVIALAEPVLKHRMALTFAARAEGESATGVINRLAAALE
jgi:hypothetical protein